MRENNGFSLVEVLVASVVFSLTMLGLTSVFVSSGKHITHAREGMSSMELGRFFLDPLQNYVRQDTWNQGGNYLNLSSSPVTFSNSPQTINTRSFSATYTVADGVAAPIDGALIGTDLRCVVATIHWNE
jgi:prepilin-type N-terminal cleavage/methylation domain-containing protein